MYSAIAKYKQSDEYKNAIDAKRYYDGENTTITQYEKILYDMKGYAHKDIYSANHKVASSFFRMVVDQQVSYLLGNGVTFQNSNTKDKLGGIDTALSKIGRNALIGGVGYGFWNVDHLDVFSRKEFIALKDERTGTVSAGIRFWQLDNDKPLYATLYEIDGYTEYAWEDGKDEAETVGEKRAYILKITSSEAGEQVTEGMNYPSFPIVPLRNGEDEKSELNGKKATIDALDLATSNMINNVDEGNLIYWVLTNCGGMDEIDDARFIEQLKLTHVTHAEGEAGARAEAHTLEAPYTGTAATIDILKKRLYEDFMAFDSSAVTATNQSATAIKASYIPLDLKCDKFEMYVIEFMDAVLKLAGIDDEVTFTRNQLINKQEEISAVVSAANYLTEDYVTEKILTILGDGDRAEEILKQRADDDFDRMKVEPVNEREGTEETGQEETDENTDEDTVV